MLLAERLRVSGLADAGGAIARATVKSAANFANRRVGE
jgi:hypothetical protein